MKKKFISFLIVPAVLLTIWTSGCYYDTVISDTSVYSGEEVTFSGDILPIFTSSCSFSECHGSGDEAPDLSEANAYNSLIAGGYIDLDNPELSELYQWVKGNRTTSMPISGTDPKVVSAIISWINQGALNN